MRIERTGSMGNALGLITFLLCGLLIVGCKAGTTTTAETSGPSMNQAASYSGPKARVAVASLECKANKCSSQIGTGMSDMISTALFQSNRFVVLERGEGLEDVKSELDFGESEYTEDRDTAEKGSVEGADIVIIGAITGFEPEASGTGGAVGAMDEVLGGFGASQTNAYIQLDLRLVDVRTSRVVNATRVEGEASSYQVGGLGGGMVGDVALGGALGTYENTPMEKAISVVLDKAVKEISSRTPEDYYRYGEDKEES